MLCDEEWDHLIGRSCMQLPEQLGNLHVNVTTGEVPH